MLAGEIDAAHAHVVVERPVHLHIDVVRVGARGGGAGDRAQLGDGVGKRAGDDARGGAWHRRVAVARGGGRDAHAPAVPLEIIVLGDGEGKLRRGRPLVVGLERDALLLAVIDVVPRLVVEDGRGAVEQARAIEDRLEAADGVFRVENIHRSAEVVAAAEDIEDLLVRDVEDRMRAVLGAPRRLLKKRRRHAHAEIVVGAAVFAHREGRARLEVDRAAERVRALVRRLALDELETLEHRAGDRLELEGPAVAERGERAAVHGDVAHGGAHAANVELVVQPLVGRAAGDAGEAHHDFARAHVRQVAKRIHRDHVLHVVGVALFGDHRGVALALAGDPERLEFVDARREVEVARDAVARGGDHRLARGVEAEVGNDELVRTGRHAVEHVAARVIGERREPQRRDRDGGALEGVARGGVAHGTGERARGIGRARGRDEQHSGGNQTQAG